MINDILREAILDYRKNKDKGFVFLYYVGGYVRDQLLGRDMDDCDIDLCINDPAGPFDFVTKSLSKFCNIKNDHSYYDVNVIKFEVELDEKVYQIEIAMTRLETYEPNSRIPKVNFTAEIPLDALRRDFRCNALYKNVITGEILDPTGNGRADIKDKLLVSVKNGGAEISYTEDPIRILRAIRLSIALNFEISKCDQSAIDTLIALNEHIFDTCLLKAGSELEKMIRSAQPSTYFCKLARGFSRDILESLLPSVADSLSPEQFKHNLKVLDEVSITGKNFNIVIDTCIRFAALFHDCGYNCQVLGNIDSVRSAELAKTDLKRLGLFTLAGSVYLYIKNINLLKPFWDGYSKSLDIPPFSMFNQVTSSLLMFTDTTRGALFTLIEADNSALNGNLKIPEYVIEQAKVSVENAIQFRKSAYYVKGEEIMQNFNLSSGELVGMLLRKVNSLRYLAPNKEALLSLYKSRYSRPVYAGLGISLDIWVSLSPFSIEDINNGYIDNTKVVSISDSTENNFALSVIKNNTDETVVVLEGVYLPHSVDVLLYLEKESSSLIELKNRLRNLVNTSGLCENRQEISLKYRDGKLEYQLGDNQSILI